MAIFDKNKKGNAPKNLSGDALSNVVSLHIIKPRITEKASVVAENNVYTFDVPTSATKGGVSKAIEALYKVTPKKVSLVSMKAKRVFAKGKKGQTSKTKKAYVYLKEGDKIEFV